MKEFNTIGTVTFDFEIDVEASTEKEAQEKALDIIKEYYHLKVKGAYHDQFLIEDVDTGEYDE